jgi:hypothetical protein
VFVVNGADRHLAMTPESTQSTRPLHLLMRYSDKVTGIEDTIVAHEDIAKRKGAVWLGKMGKTLARKHVDTLNDQCSKKIPTYVFLVQKRRGGYEVYQGNVTEVSRSFPDERQLIPSYYDKQRITSYIRLWQKVTMIRKVDSTILKRIYIATSGSPASETLQHSMAALFLVHQRS